MEQQGTNQPHTTQLPAPEGSTQPEQVNQRPQLRQQLEAFWAQKHGECQRTMDFNNDILPSETMEEIMKSFDDASEISSEASLAFAKFTEMLTHELTLRSRYHAEEKQRETIEKCDVDAAVASAGRFDLLVPKDNADLDGGDGGGVIPPPPPPPPSADA